MNVVDIIMIVVILLSSLMGIIRGLTKEVFGLTSWIGAGVAAYLLYPIAGHFTLAYIKNPTFAAVAAGFVIFLVFLIFFSLISHIISSYVKDSALGGVDRALGFGFGILRAVVLLCVIELGLSSFMPRNQYPEAMQNARFTPMIQTGSERLLAILPEKWQEFVLSQQSKFIHDHAKKDLEHKIEDALSGALTDAIQGATVQSHSHQNIEEPRTIQPKPAMDTTKAAENLAKLQAQGQTEKQGYKEEQRQDLNRLIDTLK